MIQRSTKALESFMRPESSARPHRRVRLLAKFDGFDPLAGVNVAGSTLADYSYEQADLCHKEFGNCQLHSARIA